MHHLFDTYPSDLTLMTERKRSKVCGRNCRDCACARGAISSFSLHSRDIILQIVSNSSRRLCRNCSLCFPRVLLHGKRLSYVRPGLCSKWVNVASTVQLWQLYKSTFSCLKSYLSKRALDFMINLIRNSAACKNNHNPQN